MWEERAGLPERPAIRVLWQPIVDLNCLQPIGFEALGRIAGVPNLAAALGQHGKAARTLDRQLREAALCTLGDLPHGTRLFVNLAAPTIAAVVAARKPLGYGTGGRVVWELSESGGWKLESADDVRVLFGEFALDDVGAGHADLYRLQRLRPPWVKVARPLVQGCHRDRSKQDVVRALCWLVGRYGGRVIAEGVEQRAEALCIASLGVRYAQGFFFGRPAPPAAWR